MADNTTTIDIRTDAERNDCVERWHQGDADAALLMARAVVALRTALSNFIYETTHLSAQREDGSHDCRISAATLTIGREALKL